MLLSIVAPILQHQGLDQLQGVNVNHTTQTNTQYSGYNARIALLADHFTIDDGERALCVSAENASVACMKIAADTK